MDFIKKISAVNWIKIAVIVIILVGVIIYVSQKKETIKVDTTKVIATTTTTTNKTTTVVKKVPTIVSNVTNKCNFRVTSPAMYTKVTVPFTVKGLLDTADTSKGCMWTIESSRAGTAEIFYNN